MHARQADDDGTADAAATTPEQPFPPALMRCLANSTRVITKSTVSHNSRRGSGDTKCGSGQLRSSSVYRCGRFVPQVSAGDARRRRNRDSK